MTFFIRVHKVFEIPSRGVVLVLPKDWGSDLRIRVGDRIQLRTPEARVFDTRIHAVELIKTTDGCLAGIMLPREIAKSEIPTQAEIWPSER
jgi:hypothetical protein